MVAKEDQTVLPTPHVKSVTLEISLDIYNKILNYYPKKSLTLYSSE